MKRIFYWALGASFASFALLAPVSARADSYAVYDLSGDSGYNLMGINAAGEVAIESPAGCSSADPNRCYEIFSNGELLSESDSLSGFTLDNGTSCSFAASAAEYETGRSVCDGGNQVAGVMGDNGPQIVEFLSNGSSLSLFGSADVLSVNAAGDFVVVNGLNDEIEEVIPTPEPAAIVLLLTAVGCLIMILRHRSSVRER